MPVSSSSTNGTGKGTPFSLGDFVDDRSLSAALSVWLAVCVALILRFDEPWWAAMTALRCSVRDYDAEVSLLRNRLLGTVVGGLIGLAVAPLMVDNHGLSLATSFFVFAIATYKRFTSAYAYAWVLASITCLLVVNAAIFEPAATLDIAIFRTLEVLTGVIVVYVVDRCLQPRDASGAAPVKPVIDDAKKRQIVVASIAAGTVAVVLPLVWLRFNLPQPLQVMITVFVVLNLSLSAVTTKAYQRVVGVLIGGCAGLLIASLSITSFWIWSIFLFAGMTFAAGFENSNRADAYIGLQAGFGFLFAMVTGSGPVESTFLAIDRIVGIAIGISIGIVVYLSIESLFAERDTEKE